MTAVPKFNLPPSDAETLDFLKGSSFVAQAAREKELRTLNERKLAADIRSKAEAELVANFHANEKATAAAHKAVKDAEKALETARMSFGKLFRENMSKRIALQSKFDDASRALFETSNPAISLFKSELLEELNKTLSTKVTFTTISQTHPVTGAVSHQNNSNQKSIVKRSEAIRAAYDAADDLRLLPDQSSIPELLEKIRAALPKID